MALFSVLLFALVVLLMVNSFSAQAADHYVYEDINSDTTWVANDTYIINSTSGTLGIYNGAVLTVEENVTVLVDSGVYIDVDNGRINAVGTEDLPITFTANDTGIGSYWAGIVLNDASHASKFSYVIFENSTAGLDINAMLPNIQGGMIAFFNIDGTAIEWTTSDDLTTTLPDLFFVNVDTAFYLDVDGNLTLSLSEVLIDDAEDGLEFQVDGDVDLDISKFLFIGNDSAFDVYGIDIQANGVVDLNIGTAYLSTGHTGIYVDAIEVALETNDTWFEEFTDYDVQIECYDALVDISNMDSSDSYYGIGVDAYNNATFLLEDAYFNGTDYPVYVYAMNTTVVLYDVEIFNAWNGFDLYGYTTLNVDMTYVYLNEIDYTSFYLAGGETDIAMFDVLVLDAGSGLYISEAGNVTLVAEDVVMVGLLDMVSYGFYAESDVTGDMDISMTDVMISDVSGLGASAIWFASDYDRDLNVNLEGIYIDGVSAISMTSGLFFFTDGGSIDFALTDVYVNGTAGSDANGIYFGAHYLPEVVVLEDIIVTNCSGYGFRLYEVEGDFDILMNDFAATENDMGVSFTTVFGAIDIMVNDTEIVGNGAGLILIASDGVVIDIVDSAIDDNEDVGIGATSAGAITMTAAESSFDGNYEAFILFANYDVVVGLDSVTMNENYYGLSASSDLSGNVTIVVLDSEAVGNYDHTIYTTANGWVDVLVDNSSMLSTDCGVIWMESYDDEATLEILDSVFDGSLYPGLTWYMAEEVDYEWIFIDDANYTMTSSSREEVGLPFEFMFNGEVYDSIWMDSDGYVAFDSYDAYTGALGSGDYIVPSYNPDYHVNNYARCGYDNTTDGYVTLWWFVYDDYNYLMDCFQVVIYENGDIQFNYADMESLYNDNEYGISSSGYYGIDTDLSGWISTPVLADYRSVYMTPNVIADSSIAHIYAEDFCTVIVDDSEFMNFGRQGIRAVTNDGDLDVSIIDSTFDKVCMIYGSAAFHGETYNGTIDAYFVNNSFSYMGNRAIRLYSSLYHSGEETLLVQGNHFYEVGQACVRMDTFFYGEGDFSLSSTREFIDNYGENVGYFGGHIKVDSDEGNVTLMLMDLFENNLFSGEPTYDEPDPYPEFGAFSSLLKAIVDEGDLNVDREVIIVNNTHSIPGDVYGISVTGRLICENGTADVDTVVLIEGNEIIDVDGTGDGAVNLGFCSVGMENGSFDTYRDIDVIDNTFVSLDTGGYGMYIDLKAEIDTPYEPYTKITGVVDYDYDLDIDIIGNEITSGGDGVYVDYYQYTNSNLYDFALDAAIDFSDNYVVCGGEGFYTYFYVYDYMDFYSPWGEEVTSTAVENIVIDVYDNEIYCDDDYGIDVEGYFYGYSNQDGAFVNLMHDVDFACSITDNYVYVEGYAIYIDNWMASEYGNQTSTGDFMYLIEGNVLEGYDGDGIYIDAGAESWVNSYEFNDVNDLDVVYDFDILSNVISGFDYGIDADIYTYSEYGLCDVTGAIDMTISDNEFYDIEDTGIYLYAYSAVYQSSYSASDTYHSSDAYMDLTMDVEVSGNVIEGAEMEPSALPSSESTAVYFDSEVSGFSYMDLAVSFLVDMNVITEFDTGVVIDDIDAYECTDIAITNNDFIDVGVGIFIEYVEATVADNDFTGCYWAIYAEDAWVTIERTIVMDAMAEAPYELSGAPEYSGGIAIVRCNVTIDDLYVENVDCGVELRQYGFATDSGVEEYAVITNIELVNCSERGIMLNDFDHLELSDASIVGCGYGMYIYYPEYVDISDVTIADCEYNGIYATSGNYDESIAISDTIVTGTGDDGIYVSYFDSVSLIDVDCMFNDGDGANLYYGEDVAVTDSLFLHNSDDGLYVYYYDYAVVTDIEASCNDYYGLYIYGDESVVYNGVYTDNSDDGLYGSSEILWIVDDSATLRNNDADFDGDLVIADGGELYMMNSDIELDDSYGCSIVVEEGGSLSFYNGRIGYYSDYGHNLFNVYGEMYLDNAVVNGFEKLYLAPTSDVTLMDCAVTYNDFAGIFVDGCAPNVLNTLIAYCDQYGVYVYGETAEPTIMSCDILFNDIGLYAYQADLEYVVDNIVAMNYLMGVFIEDGSGNLHDNIVVLNNDNIYVKDSTVSIIYNEIGYGDVSDAVMRNTLKMVALAYQAVLDLLDSVNINLDVDVNDYLYPGYGMDLTSLLNGQVGIHAIGSEVTCYGNQYALVETALLAEDSVVYFGDTVEKESISIPYFDANKDMKNVTIEAFVKDGVWAKDSILFMDGASIDVLDDAVMLFNSDADIMDSTLSSVDFDLYAAAGSEVTVIDTAMENAATISGSTIDVFETKTITVTDSDNNTVEGATVEIIDSDGNVVANGTTDANGEFTAIIQTAGYSTDAVNGPEMPVEETYDYTVNVTLRNQKVSQSLDEMDEQTGIVLPGSETILSTETALIVAVLIAALLAVGLVAVAFRKD